MKHTSTLPGRKTRSGTSAPKTLPSAKKVHEVPEPPASQVRNSMYDALCRSAMNRDAHAIVGAVEELLDRLERFQRDHGRGTLDRELRSAGALGEGEPLPAAVADQVDDRLEDARGLAWALWMFRSTTASGIYPLDREAIGRRWAEAEKAALARAR